MDKYASIIDIKHFEPKHERMSLYARSAQFAPFAALTGYEESVEETGRLTSERIEIEEGLKEIINGELLKIKEAIKEKPVIKVTYFIKDTKKKGGKYVTLENSIKRIDEYKKELVFVDNTKIKIEDIIKLDIKKRET